MSSSSLSSGRESMVGSSPSTCSSTGPDDGCASCGAAPGGNSRSPLRPQAASAVASTRPSRSSFVPCIFIGSFLPLPRFTEHFAPAGCCRAHIVRGGATEACPACDRIVHAEHGIYLIRDTGLHLAHFLKGKAIEIGALILGLGDQGAGHMMGLTEGQIEASDEPVGQIRCSGEAARGGRAHGGLVHGKGCHHARHGGKRKR